MLFIIMAIKSFVASKLKNPEYGILYDKSRINVLNLEEKQAEAKNLLIKEVFNNFQISIDISQITKVITSITDEAKKMNLKEKMTASTSSSQTDKQIENQTQSHFKQVFSTPKQSNNLRPQPENKSNSVSSHFKKCRQNLQIGNENDMNNDEEILQYMRPFVQHRKTISTPITAKSKVIQPRKDTFAKDNKRQIKNLEKKIKTMNSEYKEMVQIMNHEKDNSAAFSLVFEGFVVLDYDKEEQCMNEIFEQLEFCLQ